MALPVVVRNLGLNGELWEESVAQTLATVSRCSAGAVFEEIRRGHVHTMHCAPCAPASRAVRSVAGHAVVCLPSKMPEITRKTTEAMRVGNVPYARACVCCRSLVASLMCYMGPPIVLPNAPGQPYVGVVVRPAELDGFPAAAPALVMEKAGDGTADTLVGSGEATERLVEMAPLIVTPAVRAALVAGGAEIAGGAAMRCVLKHTGAAHLGPLSRGMSDPDIDIFMSSCVAADRVIAEMIAGGAERKAPESELAHPTVVHGPAETHYQVISSIVRAPGLVPTDALYQGVVPHDAAMAEVWGNRKDCAEYMLAYGAVVLGGSEVTATFDLSACVVSYNVATERWIVGPGVPYFAAAGVLGVFKPTSEKRIYKYAMKGLAVPADGGSYCLSSSSKTGWQLGRVVRGAKIVDSYVTFRWWEGGKSKVIKWRGRVARMTHRQLWFAAFRKHQRGRMVGAGEATVGMDYYCLTRGANVLMKAVYANGLADSKVLSGAEVDGEVLDTRRKAAIVVISYAVMAGRR